jgi:anti-sigma-K factor RskA
MSETPREPISEEVEEYALGLLDAADRARFEAELERDPALQRSLAATVDALAALAVSQAVTPPAQLKARVMAQLPQGAAPSGVLPFRGSPARSRAPLWLGAALAASLMLVAGLSRELQRARSEAREAHAASATQGRLLAQRDSLIGLLVDPATATVALATTGTAKPVIRAYINRSRRSLTLAATALETLPTGRAYQLWFIVDGKPVPSVTFTSDSAGHALVSGVTMPAGAIAAAAITEEPAGGSTAPTTKPIFVGKLATE